MTTRAEKFRRFIRCGLAGAASITLFLLGAVGIVTATSDAYLNSVQMDPYLSGHLALLDLGRARRFRPDLSQAWTLSAVYEDETDPAAGRSFLLHAMALDPTDWRNWQELSLIDLQLGRSQSAETDLENAAKLSTGFRVHYELANTALILGNRALFWQQMQIALQIAPENEIQPTLRDIVRLAGDEPQRIVSILPRQRPNVAAAAIEYLVGARQWSAGDQVWSRMRCDGYRAPICSNAALVLTDGWLADAQTPASASTRLPGQLGALSSAFQALAVWNSAISRGALDAPLARSDTVTDPGFQHGWVGRGFFWHGASQIGSDISIAITPAGVGVTLDGFEPENAILFWQWVATRPGRKFTLSLAARGSDVRNPLGLEAELTAVGGKVVTVVPIHLGNDWSTSAHVFESPPAAGALTLSLVYRRPLGEPLFEGEAWIKNLTITPEATQP